MKQKLNTILLLLSSFALTSCSPAFWAGFANGAAMGVSSYYSPYTPSYSSSSSSSTRTTTTRAKFEKTLKTESDGFSWYSTKQGSKRGAQTTSGGTIIPLGDYSFIWYSKENGLPSGGYFKVSCPSGDHYGAFSKTGTTIIPLSREYTFICFHGETGHVGYFGVKKNGKKGVCDVNGKEIIAPRYEDIIFISSEFKYKDSQGNWQPLGYTLDANGRGVRMSTTTTSVASTTQERMDILFARCINVAKEEELPMGPGKAPIEYICRLEFGTNIIKVSAVKVERGNGNKESILKTITFTPSSSTYTKEGDKITIEEGSYSMVIVPLSNMIGIQTIYNGIRFDGYGFVKLSDEDYEFMSELNKYTSIKRPALDEHSRVTSKINKVVTKVNSYKFKNR